MLGSKLTAQPFNDLRHVLSQLPEADSCAAKKLNNGSAGKPGEETDGLFALKSWLAVWQGTAAPSVKEAHICVLASSYHGDPVETVTKFIADAAKGKAPVNRLCIERGTGLRVLELAPDVPYNPDTPWSETECMAAVAFGMEASAAGGHLLGLSDLAPGNVSRALSIIACVGKGEALESLAAFEAEGGAEARLQEEAVALVKAFLAAGEMSQTDPLQALLRLGGREIAASVGALIAARSRRLPVLIDGWAGLAAAAILEAEKAGSADHVKVASASGPLFCFASRLLGKTPLLTPSVASGAGCGNAVSISILNAACEL